jgi:hypothetical protein
MRYSLEHFWFIVGDSQQLCYIVAFGRPLGSFHYKPLRDDTSEFLYSNPTMFPQEIKNRRIAAYTIGHYIGSKVAFLEVPESNCASKSPDTD